MVEINQASKDEKNPLNHGKNFISPFILLVLKNLNLHGYLIMKELSKFGFYSIDQGNFYRTLRKLEKDELICSEWELSEDGPARRVYSITKLGEEYLSLWAGSMKNTQTILTNFFSLYSSLLNPFNIKEENNE